MPPTEIAILKLSATLVINIPSRKSEFRRAVLRIGPEQLVILQNQRTRVPSILMQCSNSRRKRRKHNWCRNDKNFPQLTTQPNIKTNNPIVTPSIRDSQPRQFQRGTKDSRQCRNGRFSSRSLLFSSLFFFSPFVLIALDFPVRGAMGNQMSPKLPRLRSVHPLSNQRK